MPNKYRIQEAASTVADAARAVEEVVTHLPAGLAHKITNMPPILAPVCSPPAGIYGMFNVYKVTKLGVEVGETADVTWPVPWEALRLEDAVLVLGYL